MADDEEVAVVVEEDQQSEILPDESSNNMMILEDKIKEAVVAVSKPESSEYFEYNGTDDDDMIIPNNIEHLVIGVNVTELPIELFQKHCKHSLKVLEFEQEQEEEEDIGSSSSSSPRSRSSKLRSIADNAFERYEQLQQIINLPSSLMVIGNNAFRGCESLESITFASSSPPLATTKSSTKSSKLEMIQPGAFSGCMKLVSIVIPNSVHTIGKDSFSRCHHLQSITLSSQLQTIGDDAFERCKKLTKINFPKSIKSIGNNSFTGCESLMEINFELSSPSSCNNNENNIDTTTSTTDDTSSSSSYLIIGSKAFLGCEKLRSILFPSNITNIGERAFSLCDSLTKVEFVNLESTNLQELPEGAFYECVKLTYVELPKIMSSIGKRAFYNCFALTTIYLPSNSALTTIDYEAYKGCDQLFNFQSTAHNELHNLLYHHDSDDLVNKLHDLYDQNPSLFDETIIDSEDSEQLNMTPLHIYVASTTSKTIDLGIVKILITTFPQSLISDDKWGRRPIHYACMTGSIEGGGHGQQQHGQQQQLFDELTAVSRSDTTLSNTPGAISVVLGEDLDGNTPLTFGIRYGYLSLDVCVMLYGLNPISFEQIDDEDLMEEETLRLIEIITAYINTMITTTTTTTEQEPFSKDKQHGWVNFLKQGFFVNNDDDDENNKPKKKKKKKKKGQPQLPDFESLLSELIEDDTICSDATITQLAYAQDYNNQKAIDVVQGQIKIAFENRLSNKVTSNNDNDGTAALVALTTVPSVGSREAIPSPTKVEEEEDDDDDDGTAAALVAATTVAAVASRDQSKDKDRPGKGSLSDKPMVKPPDYDDGDEELPEKPEIPPPPPDYVPPVFEEPSKPKQSSSSVAEKKGPTLSRARVASIPVNLYTDDQTGQQYFFLKRYTFPQRKMNKLFIRYDPNQVDDALNFQQQQQQLESPEQNVNNGSSNIVMLYNCPVECYFEGGGEGGCAEPSSPMEESTELLTDTSFQLKGFKIRAIRIRMYMKQKLQAQQQLSQAGGKNNSVIKLNCDIECRLVPSSLTTEPKSDSTPLADISTRSATGSLVGIAELADLDEFIEPPSTE